ncbi:MAG: hypothetical protein WC072_05440, partial [Methanoregulaceae archaeon]
MGPRGLEKGGGESLPIPGKHHDDPIVVEVDVAVECPVHNPPARLLDEVPQVVVVADPHGDAVAPVSDGGPGHRAGEQVLGGG